MGISSRAGSAGDRTRLIRLIEKRAFESFLRHGRVPRIEAELAEAARKLALKAIPAGRPTTHYTWRTAKDERVRSAHKVLDGKVFAWDDVPPDGHHPSQAPNCRCWPEPYFGSPDVPDSALKLDAKTRTDATGKQPWRQIDKLARPDGSIAKSTILLRNGGHVTSTFVGPKVTHRVHVPDHPPVRIEKDGRFRAFYFGRDSDPTIDRPALFLSPIPGGQPDEIPIFDPFRVGPSEDDLLGAALIAALLLLFNMLQAEPESLGAGKADVPALKVWPPGKTSLLGSLTVMSPEELERSCKRLPDVQGWTDEAAKALSSQRSVMSPANWGTVVHRRVENTIIALKKTFGLAYQDIEAEFSFDAQGSPNVRRGQKGSTRLDVFEKVSKDLICVYDIKTGGAQLTEKRVAEIAARVALRYGSARFFIIEVRPAE